jgi:serine/threonine-protein kinase
VKVLDFGISKNSSALGQAPSSLTSTKAMLGSPLYVSPEQVRSSKNVDARTDIWAIGVILYELLTGDLPFMGDNLGELFAAILEEAPVPLRTRAPAVPPGLEEIVLRCLEKRPDNRLQTAQDVIEALRPFGAVQQGTVVLGVQSPFAHGAPAPVSPGAQTRPGAITGGGPPLGSAPPGAMQPPPGMGGVTPYPMMMMTPPGGAITGSGVHPPVVTPQTGDWAQSTGGGAMIPAKSSAPLMLGVAGVLVVAAAVGIGLIWKSSTASTKPGTPATLTSGASAEPPPVSATASPAVPATVATAPAAEPSGATAPAATVAAKPSAKPAVPAVTKDEPKPVVVKPAEPKPADPKPADPKPAASAKPATTGNPSGIQDYR